MPLAPKTNPHGEDLTCRCGARAPYLFLALLDETGEPKLDTGRVSTIHILTISNVRYFRD